MVKDLCQGEMAQADILFHLVAELGNHVSALGFSLATEQIRVEIY